ncbi:PREDICTED: uncharacterized protein LOC104737679 [Camelina sativa]|uniref:Uncharacterized protein LOC104737679 n=1 Tax=Camelina sativa TaxID=90675 RepID=A0ABM0VHH6_CAMSA|nr:PREDICTED: uncharacterized protein LOC104737679 [Camelina sativa]
MGSTTINTNLGLTITVFVFCVISNLHSMVHCANNNSIGDLDDLIRSYAASATTSTRRRQTGSLYAISLPSNLSDIKASVVTVRNSEFWRKGTNFSGILIPPMVKTTPYAKRIAFVYESFGNHSSSVYFRLADNYTFVSPVNGFTGYDATNTNDLKNLNLSIKRDDPIVIKLDPYASRDDRRGIKCIVFGDNGLFSSFSNTIRDYECAATNTHGHYYALVVLNEKPKPKHEPEVSRRNWWWFVLTGIGVSVIVVVVIVVVVKLVKKKRLREMERESEKSETIGNVWIGRSRMPSATMVRTQPCLEYHEDLPSSSNIP